MQLVLQKNKEREKRRRTARPHVSAGIHAPTFRGANLEVQSYAGTEWMLSGPAECVAGETRIPDPVTGEVRTIKELAEAGQPITVMTAYGPALAEAPFKKGTAPLYRVTMEGGRSFLATARHRMLTAQGWRFVSELRAGALVPSYGQSLQASNSGLYLSEFQQGGPHWSRIDQDCPDDYSAYCRLCDEQPLPDQAGGQAFLPSQGDALSRSRGGHNSDGPCALSGHSRHHQLFDRLSIGDYFPSPVSIAGDQCLALLGKREHVCYWSRDGAQSRLAIDSQRKAPAVQRTGDSMRPSFLGRLGFPAALVPFEPAGVIAQCEGRLSRCLGFQRKQFGPDDAALVLFALRSLLPYSGHYTAQLDTVASVKYERADDFYDMHVPGPEHYFAEGFIHHNTGKTWAALWRLDSLLRSTPRVKATLARKIQSSIYGTVLVTWESIQELRAALGYPRAMAFGGEKPQWYNYPNGSRLWVGGLDNPQKILSAERDFIYINQAEEVTLQDWEYCITRATGRGSVVENTMVMGDCNPGSEDHWIQKRATLKVFYSKHVDNPSLYTDAGELTPQGVKSITALKSLTGIRRKRLYEGQWVGAEGLFFEEFDPEDSRFVIEPLKTIPADWPIWGALDYGFKHPTAFGLFTQDNDGTIYLIGEHAQHQWPVSHHCKAIRRLLAKLGIEARRMRKVVAGHDVFQERGAADGKTIADQYRDAVNPEADELLLNGEVVKMPQGMPIGFKLEMANVARITGAQELLMRFGNREMNIAPSLLLYNTCPRTAATIARMVTDPREAEDVKKVDADLNGDGGDDQYDCLRYGTMAAWVTRKGVMTISRHRV